VGRTQQQDFCGQAVEAKIELRVFAPPRALIELTEEDALVGWDENELGKQIVDLAFQVHTKLGPGLLESVYEVALAHELSKRGIHGNRQVPIRVQYDQVVFDQGFRADLVVENLIIFELKSVEELHPVHKKQLLTYLRLAHKRLGFLINFGAELIKQGITRIVNGAGDWKTEHRTSRLRET
jgi:GxxExxY protein